MRGIRFLTAGVVVLAVVAIGIFLYVTREIAAPSQNVQDSVQQLNVVEATDSAILFRISQAESLVEYNIAEMLNGVDTLVIGTTDQVAGDVLINLSDLSQSELGEISINARTFATDEDRRDNAVARFVLQSEDAANEFIIFVPSSISGLPDSANLSNTLEFQVTGELTIAGTTQEVSFDVSASLDDLEQLAGQAITTVRYTDFGLSIPDVPFVASVEDEVSLKLEFVAHAVTAS